MYSIRKRPIEKYFETNTPRANVLHVDLGTAEGTFNHLKNVASASYHFYIPKEGNEIWQFVPVEKGAWHAGIKEIAKYKPSQRAIDFFDLDQGRSVNTQSVGICYEGRGIDASGNVTSDWDKVVDGERASDEQVEKAVWLIKNLGLEKLPLFAHKEITIWKPKCVLDFKERVAKGLEDENNKCTLSQFTAIEIIKELISRIK